MLRLGATLYSFQDDYRMGRMTLEESLAFLHSIGANGVEIVPEQTMSDVQYETIDDAFVAQWKEWMQKYNLTPTNCNLYDDYDMYANRYLTEDERFAQFKHGVRLAQALGFTSVRGCPDMPTSLLERCIKVAEDHGIVISLEVHAPFFMKSNWMQNWFELIERLNTSYAGIHPDAQIFSRGFNATDARKALAKGANPEIIAFIREELLELKERRAAQREMLPYEGFYDFPGYGTDELREKILSMGGGRARNTTGCHVFL